MRQKRKIALVTLWVAIYGTLVVAAIESTGIISESVSTPSRAVWELGVGAGIAAVPSGSGPAINLLAETRLGLDFPFYMGLELGGENFAAFSGKNPLSGYPERVSEPSGLVLHALPTFTYRFEGLLGREWVPQIGLAVGPALVLAKAKAVGSGQPVNTTNVVAAALVKPGVQYRWNRILGILVEGRFGLIGSAFLLQPQVNALISL